MSIALALLISAGIIAFGLWSIAYFIEAGSPIGLLISE
jgi:hypothetical protein